VLHADKPDRLQFAGARVNLRIGYSGRPFGYDQVDRGQYDHVRDVEWVTGSAMMMSRACLEATGGFDDHFFAFHEDVDLSLRARASGFRVVMSPLSRVWHLGGGSLQGPASPTHMYYSVRNALRLVENHRPAPNPAFGLLRGACIAGAHTAQVLISRPSRAAFRGTVEGVRDYVRGVTGPRPSAPHLTQASVPGTPEPTQSMIQRER
jgi:GT2 family glycosyltransferase